MTKQEKIDDIVDNWNSLDFRKKQIICDEALHQSVADHQGVSLEQIKSEGDPILRQPLPDILGDLSDSELNDVHSKYTEVK